MFIIRDSKGVLFTGFTSRAQAQRVIDMRSMYSEYASKFWYVEEIKS